MCACADGLDFKYSNLKMFLLKLGSELQYFIKKFQFVLKIWNNVHCISTKWYISMKYSISFRGNIPLGGNNLFVVWYCEMKVCACTDILHFRLKGDTIFLKRSS